MKIEGFLKNRTVFVTGATGMVGSWLIKALLRESARVITLIYESEPQSELYRSGDIRRVTAIQGELEDCKKLSQILKKYRVDTVFHLGAQAIVETAHASPLPTFEANIRGTYNLLEACRIHKDFVKRIVIASSDKAYGTQTHLPYKEDMPLQGQYPYEVSKSCADLLAQSYYHTYQLPIAIVRCGNIYGGGDLNWSRIVPGTIRSFLMNKRPIVRSDGTYIRDYVYIKDVCQTYLLIAAQLADKRFKGQAFNMSDESPLTVLQLIKDIAKLMDCQHLKPKVLNTARGEIRAQYLSSAKIKKMLKWKPCYGLTNGLKETIEWYREFFAKK